MSFLYLGGLLLTIIFRSAMVSYLKFLKNTNL